MNSERTTFRQKCNFKAAVELKEKEQWCSSGVVSEALLSFLYINNLDLGI